MMAGALGSLIATRATMMHVGRVSCCSLLSNVQDQYGRPGSAMGLHAHGAAPCSAAAAGHGGLWFWQQHDLRLVAERGGRHQLQVR